jgi:hypothetical protein
MSGYQVDPEAVAVLREQSCAMRRHTVELRLTAISSMHESSTDLVLAKNTAVGWLEESFHKLEEARQPRSPNANKIPDLRNRYVANILHVIAYVFAINRRMKREKALAEFSSDSLTIHASAAVKQKIKDMLRELYPPRVAGSS